MSAPPDLSQEYAAAAARAGLTIPDDRMKGIVKLYGELKDMTALLRGMDIAPADEPANIYGFGPILRRK